MVYFKLIGQLFSKAICRSQKPHITNVKSYKKEPILELSKICSNLRVEELFLDLSEAIIQSDPKEELTKVNNRLLSKLRSMVCKLRFFCASLLMYFVYTALRCSKKLVFVTYNWFRKKSNKINNGEYPEKGKVIQDVKALIEQIISSGSDNA